MGSTAKVFFAAVVLQLLALAAGAQQVTLPLDKFEELRARANPEAGNAGEAAGPLGVGAGRIRGEGGPGERPRGPDAAADALRRQVADRAAGRGGVVHRRRFQGHGGAGGGRGQGARDARAGARPARGAPRIGRAGRLATTRPPGRPGASACASRRRPWCAAASRRRRSVEEIDPEGSGLVAPAAPGVPGAWTFVALPSHRGPLDPLRQGGGPPAGPASAPLRGDLGHPSTLSRTRLQVPAGSRRGWLKGVWRRCGCRCRRGLR